MAELAIEVLDVGLFGEYNWTSELDVFHLLKNQKVAKEHVREKIESLKRGSVVQLV